MMEQFNTTEETAQPVQDDNFPPKPELTASETTMRPMLVSLMLFVLAYYVFFDKDLRMIGLMVAVLLIHELGHFLAMKYFRYSELKMFFIPFLGAMVSGEKRDISQRQRAIILLAGPVPGIIIGAALYFVGIKTGSKDILTASGIFIFLNAANLLPLTPLDGGRLIETLFFHNQALLRNIFTFISGAAVTVLAIRYRLYSLLLIPFFMLSRLTQYGALRKLKDNLDAQGLDYNKPYDLLSNREYWLIREQVVSGIRAFATVDPKLYQVSPRERQIIQQIRSLAERQPIPDLGAGGIILFTLIWAIFLGLPAAGMLMLLYARM